MLTNNKIENPGINVDDFWRSPVFNERSECSIRCVRHKAKASRRLIPGFSIF